MNLQIGGGQKYEIFADVLNGSPLMGRRGHSNEKFNAFLQIFEEVERVNLGKFKHFPRHHDSGLGRPKNPQLLGIFKIGLIF